MRIFNVECGSGKEYFVC